MHKKVSQVIFSCSRLGAPGKKRGGKREEREERREREEREKKRRRQP